MTRREGVETKKDRDVWRTEGTMYGAPVPAEKSGEKRRPRTALERWTIAPRANRMFNDTPIQKEELDLTFVVLLGESWNELAF